MSELDEESKIDIKNEIKLKYFFSQIYYLKNKMN